jgi:hypothetical protein
MPRRPDAQLDPRSRDLDHFNFDILAEDDRFSHAAAQN